jgi:CBS domain-containing protein
MGKTVRDAMTSNPRTAGRSASVVDVARIMKSENVGAVPIVDDGRLVGMLTDRDIAVRTVAEGDDPQSTTAADVASRDPVTVEPQQDLDAALQLMAAHQVRRLPVVEDGALVGILAQADVALETKDKKAGEVLGEISKPGAAG